MVAATGRAGESGGEEEGDIFRDIYNSVPSQRSGPGYERGEEADDDDNEAIDRALEEEECGNGNAEVDPLDVDDEMAWKAAFGDWSDESAEQPEEDRRVAGDGVDIDECDDDHAREDGYEEAKISAARSPVQPTADEVERHRMTHWPFRDWCEICVAARGKEEGHFRKESGYVRQGVPTVCLDYK